MFVLYVSVQAKPEFIEEFKKACVENAQNSIKEAGNVRFDVLQQSDEPSRFVLIEAYLNDDDLEKHRQTPHYSKWRQRVEKMLVGERIKTIFKPIWPEKY